MKKSILFLNLILSLLITQSVMAQITFDNVLAIETKFKAKKVNNDIFNSF